MNLLSSLLLLEEKLSELKLSYNRQLSLLGNPRYDVKLTFELKKDIEWMESQKTLLETDNLNNSMRRKV